MTEFDPRFLAMLVCPVSKAPVVYDEARDIFVCEASGLYYLNRHRTDQHPGVPDLRPAEAHKLADLPAAYGD